MHRGDIDIQFYGACAQSLVLGGGVKVCLKIIYHEIAGIPSLMDTGKPKVKDSHTLSIHPGKVAPKARAHQLSNNCLDWDIIFPERLERNLLSGCCNNWEEALT